MRNKGPLAKKIAIYLILTLMAAVVLFPVYVALVGSLLIPEQLGSRPPTLFPNHPQWHTYSDAWTSGHFATYLRNSFIMTAVITVGQVATSILAGYSFAMLEFPFKRTIFVVFLATGFGAFLLRQAFLQIPRDLRDAAEVDGYGHLKFMARVAVPLARPTIAALAVFSFLGAWNQYLWPLLVTKDNRLRTVQIGLKYLQGTSLSDVNVTLAGTVLAALPLVLLLIVFQKQLIRGLTAGAVKG